VNKSGKPVDQTEWFMRPSTANAFINVHMNEIVFSAGRLQPPLYHPKADNAVNYSKIGAVTQSD